MKAGKTETGEKPGRTVGRKQKQTTSTWER